MRGIRSAAPLLLTAILAFALLAGPPRPARAAAGLDLSDWLSRPGVRLVVVEFYATWCKPCMAAVPKWKALHERYRDQGLRLIVVNTQDPEGRCLNPGWNPDEMICDEDGSLARRLGVGEALPAALLWSWQGRLLVRQGHVDDVERVARAYLRGLPRVLVQVAPGAAPAGLGALLRDELTRTGKIAVAAGDDERALLDELRRRSHDPRYDDEARCELGEELPPNAVLKAEVYSPKGGKRGAARLALGLHSTDSGCALQAVTVSWNPERPQVSAAEAVSKLLSRLRGPLQLPGTGAAPPPPRPTAPRGDSAGSLFLRVDVDDVAWQVEGTDEAGALKAGKPVQVSLPWSGTPYRVRLEKAGYHPYAATVLVDQAHPVANVDHVMAREVARGATAERGFLDLKSSPSNAEVEIDGQPVPEKTPTTVELAAGPHSVRIGRPLYRAWTGTVDVPAGDIARVDRTLAANFGALVIEAPQGATILLDGERVGSGAWSNERQEAGGYALRVTAPQHDPHEATIYVEPGGRTVERVTLRPRFGTLAVTVVETFDDLEDAAPALFLDGAPVTASFQAAGKGRVRAELPRVADGPHDVEVQLDGFATWTGSVEVPSGGEAKVEARLEPRFGLLDVRSEPAGAAVIVDGTQAGRTPLRRKVAEGNHALEVRADAEHLRPHSAHVAVRRGTEEKLVVTLEEITGALLVATEPPGATVSVDGQRVGTSPVRMEAARVGRREVVIEKEGWERKVLAVTVAEGRTAMERVTLEERKGPPGMVWVRLPGGSFQMGSTDGDSREKPVHRVTVDGFELTKSEVTVAQYRACVDAGTCNAGGTGEYCNWDKGDRGAHPINCVDWGQSAAFCKWAGGRLPTEAEWEYAARSGGRDWTYPWGNEQATCSRAVMDDGGDGCGKNRTWPVCSKSAGHSAQGLCDMAGNVWEWVADWYGDYSPAASRNPTGPGSGSVRVCRGGGWFNPAAGLRAAYRNGNRPGDRGSGLGFRCLRSHP